MGWGVEYQIDMYLSKQDYGENIFQVEDKIEELEEYINNTKTKINMFAASSISEVIPDDWKEEPIRWINKEIDELIDYLHECIIHRYQLELYKEYLQEKQKK